MLCCYCDASPINQSIKPLTLNEVNIKLGLKNWISKPAVTVVTEQFEKDHCTGFACVGIKY